MKRVRALVKKARLIAEGIEISEIRSYYMGVLYYEEMRYNESADLFKRSREDLYKYGNIVKEIDVYLEKISAKIGDPNVIPKKVLGMWNDVELEFDSERERDAFFEKDGFLKPDSFIFKVKGHIDVIDRRRSALIRLINNSPGRTRCIFEKTKKLGEALRSFHVFLSKSYLKSDHISKCTEDVDALMRFIDTKRHGASKEVLDELEIPDDFKEWEKSLRHQDDEIDVRLIRQSLTSYLDEKFTVKEREFNIPFLPVFYDLAYDFIKYPNENGRIIRKIISRLSSISFRK